MKSDSEHKMDLLEIYRRNVRIFRKQVSVFGVNTPQHIISQLEDNRREVAKICKELNLSLQDGDTANDFEKSVGVEV